MKEFKFYSEWFIKAKDEEEAFDKFLYESWDFASEARVKEVCPMCRVEAGKPHQFSHSELA